MKQTLLALLVVSALSLSTGCASMNPMIDHKAGYSHAGCSNCGKHGKHGRGHFAKHGGSNPCGNNDGAAFAGPAGPPMGAVSYPYYTIRGPRDFLVDNPPSIGR